MSGASRGPLFILLSDQLANRREKALLPRQKTDEDCVTVLQGSLWTLSNPDGEDSNSIYMGGRPKLTLHSAEFDGVVLQTTQSEVERLSEPEFELLIGLSTCADRHKVFRDKEWLREGLEIDKDSLVYILNSPDLPERVPGKVRYKGRLPGKSGIWFGVELSAEYHGKGTSDGRFRKEQYFTSPMDSAVFININKLRWCGDASLFRESLVHSPAGAAEPSYAGEEAEESRPPLGIGERVVWMSDSGPETGCVKWIGYLHDTRDKEWTVGVQFENAVGTGTGKYKDRQLFRAPQNHASLIPILGLIKYNEFYGTTPPLPKKTIDPSLQVKIPEPSGERPIPPARLRSRGHERSMDPNKSKSRYDTPDNPESAIHNLWRTQSASSRSDSGSSRAHTSPIPGIQINSQYASYQHQQPDTLTRAQNRSRDYDSESGPKSLDPAEIVTDLEIGSMVEVVGNPPNCQYGVIRWMGYLNDKNKPIVGLEMEEENSACTDGTFGSRHLFSCPPRKAFFVYLHKCRRDPRFEESTRYLERSDSQLFGSMESPDIPGTVAPPGIIIDIQLYCGKGRGIQGHHNSCYLDATLFSMFAFTMAFDTILYRPRMEGDLQEYEEVQHVLKDSIVNPLRKNFYVRADKVLRLRSLLDRLGSVKGLTTEEKDPEEFLNSLLQQIMRAEPFLKLSNGQESYFYQLFIEKDERLVLPTTQQLLGLSFLQADIKLAEVPSCLILQMPRFGKNYKMYKRIVPSLYLDVTDILEYGPRECTICGELANYECKECYTHFGDGLDQIAFCSNCLRKSHSHSKRSNHRPRELKTHPAYIEYLNSRNLQQQNGVPVHREMMELFAVVCIETSHYVAFVKCGTGPSAPWVFFDSMADRMGEQHGYNVPEVREVPDMNDWLADQKQSDIMAVEDDKLLPEPMKRLLCDGYMCMYQSTDTMMYK